MHRSSARAGRAGGKCDSSPIARGIGAAAGQTLTALPGEPILRGTPAVPLSGNLHRHWGCQSPNADLELHDMKES
jgi:hypothetical protein